ncbi:MAG: hypothetical protein MN733_17035 [Nitrososphaera sp.]|nr:hypothetical protein [Nitrososphaera sp.]
MRSIFSRSTISSTLAGVVIGFLFVGFVAYAAFQPPTQGPPSGNVDPPLHGGIETQIKAGALVLNATAGTPTGLEVEAGDVVLGSDGTTYLQLDTVLGLPGGTCDASTEGRTIVDTTNSRLYICIASTWKSVQLL